MLQKVQREVGRSVLLPGRAGGWKEDLPADPGDSCSGCCHLGNESLLSSEEVQGKEIKGK